MITAITPEPAISGTTNMSAYRYRPAMGERTVLPNSTASAPKNSAPSEDGRFPEPDRKTPQQPEAPRKDSSSIFAAAVISGALSPTPKTMEELMVRIGTSQIPEELEARLKDILV